MSCKNNGEKSIGPRANLASLSFSSFTLVHMDTTTDALKEILAANWMEDSSDVAKENPLCAAMTNVSSRTDQ